MVTSECVHYATNQYYDNVAGTDTVNVQFYNEVSVVSIPIKVRQTAQYCDILFCEALDNLG